MLKFKKTDNFDEIEENDSYLDEGFESMEDEDNGFDTLADPAPSFGAPATAALKSSTLRSSRMPLKLPIS